MNALTHDQLKAILFAYSQTGSQDAKRLNTAIYRFAEMAESPEDPRNLRVLDATRDYISDRIAKRMLSVKKEEIILGPELQGEAFSYMLERLREEAPEIEETEFELISVMLKKSIDNLIDIFSPAVPVDYNTYNFQWKIINTIRELAQKNGGNPADSVFILRIYDEITKSLYTKADYTQMLSDAASKALNVDLIMNIVLVPLITALANGEPEFMEELRENMEDELRAQLTELFAKVKPFLFQKYIPGEVSRIYG